MRQKYCYIVAVVFLVILVFCIGSSSHKHPNYSYEDPRLTQTDIRVGVIISLDYNQSENVNRVDFVENGNLTIAVYDFEVDGVDCRAVFVFDEDYMLVDKTYYVID